MGHDTTGREGRREPERQTPERERKMKIVRERRDRLWGVWGGCRAEHTSSTSNEARVRRDSGVGQIEETMKNGAAALLLPLRDLLRAATL